METHTNYLQVIPDSQSYDRLGQILQSLKYVKDGMHDIDYMIIGLQNTIKNGYELSKEPEKPII